jgi:hypothetical protein
MLADKALSFPKNVDDDDDDVTCYVSIDELICFVPMWSFLRL